MLATLAMILCVGCALPSDSALERNFYQHEADFNQIAIMAIQDHRVTRIAEDFTWLESDTSWPRPESQLGFSKQRWDEYRTLFQKLGITGGLSRMRTNDVIFLSVSARGLATGGDEKGYAYSTKKLSPLFESLDDVSINDIESLRPAFKKLKDNWYIYYLWDD